MELANSNNIFSKSDFKEIRVMANDYLAAKGLPDKKNEEYKYTSISTLIEKTFGHTLTPTSKSELSAVSEFLIPDFDCYFLVLVNGKWKKELSNYPAELQVNDQPDDAQIGTIAKIENNGFVALNALHFDHCLSIKIAESSQVNKPIFIIHISDVQEENSISMPRILIDLGEQSKSSFYVGYFSKGDYTSFTNAVVEVFSGKASHSRLTQIQNESNAAITHTNIYVQQSRDSNFNSICVSLGGKMVRNNLNVILDDENIESHLYGLYQLTDNQHVDNHTVVDHKKPNSVSNELYKGILDEKSTGVFNGKIYVRPSAQKTNAFQSNKNILLSNDAAVNTKPQLEIWADDVKCSHGCTTGQLDEEQIFYLQSRGISKDMALKMVLKAFQHDILSRIEVKAVVDYLDKEIIRRFGGENQ